MRAYSSLRPSEQKVAEYFLTNAETLKKKKIRDIAQGAGVSEPTVIRCVRGLGYKGYKDFQRRLLIAGREKEPQFDFMRGLSLKPWDRIEDLPLRAVETYWNSFERILKSVEAESLRSAAEWLARAPIIDLYAVENSITPANDMMVKLTYLGLRCRLFVDPYLQQISAAHLEPGDAAIAFSRSGRSIDTVDALRRAKRAGAATIAVTGNEDTLISRYADVTLLTENEKSGVLKTEHTVYGNAVFSRVTDAAIVDLLYMSLILSDYSRFAANLDRSGQVIAGRGYEEEPADEKGPGKGAR